jgi:beta-glucosidase
MKMKKPLIFLAFLSMSFTKHQLLPYQNPNLSSEVRAKDLVSRLTLKEKVMLMKDVSDAIPRLGIKKFNWWSEALHGYANQGPVTVFPEPVAMAASFDDQTLFHVFDAVSDEIRAKNNDYRKKGESQRFHDLSVWTPNVNIFRDPRWRRPFSYFKNGRCSSKGTAGANRSQIPKGFGMCQALCCAFRS